MARCLIAWLIGCLSLWLLSGCSTSHPSLFGPPVALAEVDHLETRMMQAILDSLQFGDKGLEGWLGEAFEKRAVRHADAAMDLPILMELREYTALREGEQTISLAALEERKRQDYSQMLRGLKVDNEDLYLDTDPAAPFQAPRFQLLFAAYCNPDPRNAPTLLPVLREALQDRFSGTRALAAVGLGKLGPAAQAASGDLLETLRDPHPVVRCYAARALWQIEGSSAEALAALVTELRSPCKDVPDLAALFLGSMGAGAASAVPALCEAARHDCPTVRAQALYALGRIGRKSELALAALCDAPRDSRNRALVDHASGWSHEWGSGQNPSQRPAMGTASVFFLPPGPRGFEGISSIFEHTMGNEQRSVRSYAAVALGRLGPDAAEAAPLLVAMKKESWRGSTDWLAADEALKKIAR